MSVMIVHTRWNLAIVQSLVDGAKTQLLALGVNPDNIATYDVPGSFELPLATKSLMKNMRNRNGEPYNACISIGVLIKGSTMHFEYICNATSQGLMQVGLDLGKPVIFGVLTCVTERQALERAGMVDDPEVSHNHGKDWATAAVEMVHLCS
ncbi:6,7-dimethyl-8-ribityllumazine synthase [Batrachochytrium dendrobatidis JEL423]|nr:6,7-dimethyl-8-ribityllumazine synthase [Batrachochytrium dendrobatidis JEL423]